MKAGEHKHTVRLQCMRRDPSTLTVGEVSWALWAGVSVEHLLRGGLAADKLGEARRLAALIPDEGGAS